MTNILKFWASFVVVLFFVSCGSDTGDDTPAVDAPILVSSTPEAGATKVKRGAITIELKYDKNIFFASKDLNRIAFTGGELLSADVLGASSTLTVKVNVPTRETTCTLSIPEGVIVGANQTPVSAVSLQFSTAALDKKLVNASATAATQKVYAYLLENYESKTFSAMMANVNWNTEKAEQVYQWTGKHPAINCFDYIHLYASGENWINYSDITPVKNWWDAGGLVAAMWHWNVPTADPASASEKNYAFYKADTSFDADKALAEGTWENKVFTEDLAKIVDCLKLLQDEDIPVIWRPFHEAAGGWFWWGKNAASLKAMWIAMFDYFKAQGLNNLIWVWTTETGDEDWYPGDAYVDIIGRDLYGNSSSSCASQYASIVDAYGNKMVALSECGYSEYTTSVVGKISEQWAAGARWLWFMPWYDNAGAASFHADQSWWQDAMNQDFVITREDLP